MGVIHAVFPQEWRVLGLLLLDAVLDCEGLSGEAGPGGLDSGSAYSSSSCPCGVGWEVRAGEILMGRVVVGPPRWREQRSRSRGEAVVGEA